jgi:nicotinate-nucleotide adenylyltransferase
MNIEKWKNGNIIMDKYTIYVYERPGFTISTQMKVKDLKIRRAPMTEISASLIRKMIQEGKSIRYLVPDIVKEEIERNAYYKTKN